MRKKFRTKIDELDYNYQISVNVTQQRLDKISKGRLRIQRVRATLGEIYHHARRGEVLVTLDRQTPKIVPIDDLGDLVSQMKEKGKGVLATWSGIITLSQSYSRNRKKVVHPWERKK